MELNRGSLATGVFAFQLRPFGSGVRGVGADLQEKGYQLF
jgi:hypothetical protein